MPTDDERTQIAEAKAAHPDAPLGPAEEFLYTLASIPELHARLSLWQFNYVFQQVEEVGWRVEGGKGGEWEGWRRWVGWWRVRRWRVGGWRVGRVEGGGWEEWRVGKVEGGRWRSEEWRVEGGDEGGRCGGWEGWRVGRVEGGKRERKQVGGWLAR